MDGSLNDEDDTPATARRAILIAGPTASGKSALALSLAKRLNGVIINADSMQLYEDLRLVSARPSAAEEAEVPHRLYGVLPASTAFSTGAWLRLAEQELGAAWASGQMPILVGGTGLYFKGLTEGFAEMPDIPQEIRNRARAIADDEGVEGLKQRLISEGDPASAETLADPQRLARSLEVLLATGRSLKAWQQEAQSSPLLAPQACHRIVLAPPRPWLHERIEQRARLMVSEEGLREVRELLAKDLSEKLPAMRAIGVPELGGYLAGESDCAETIHRLTVATRQYAKRQETWFRNQMTDWQRVDPSNRIEMEALLRTN
ncbi:tRNA (adenosine(37)-N6)-dimethylallyltransferase MiaA [Stappia sp. BW2]|uniref:tRNA (adenosine(37)-N6)-dimethylallyltransferase MiaA n=1 Tax=Stappia sp. BW2 TaxID=2592622 RepID=UPI0011DEBC8D|nr:tRNA (adenosine(37)-N6)-dimethylallyltransferase MiaA [Stappia sp. BW2]TYC66123.1 tRNA (adenosine(37)-N6)-dimethylallyltransferase MiaA [Stappia sp. BW2]